MSKSTSVRIENDATERLKPISERSGVSVTKLITLACYLYAEHVQKTGEINIALKDQPPKVAEPRTEYGSKKKNGNGK